MACRPLKRYATGDLFRRFVGVFLGVMMSMARLNTWPVLSTCSSVAVSINRFDCSASVGVGLGFLGTFTPFAMWFLVNELFHRLTAPLSRQATISRHVPHLQCQGLCGWNTENQTRQDNDLNGCAHNADTRLSCHA